MQKDFVTLRKVATFAIRKFNLKRMYAIVKIAGQQFKVEKGRRIFVHRLAHAEGEKLNFDEVLLVDNEGTVQVGMPTVRGAKISAQVLSHLRGDKVLVFKKKRRKGYQKCNGHRQNFTQILVEDIVLS